ncbi:vesicle coat component [Chytridiales sp. JEL 0842]|nr:vesicle coat component [Chytridiales sp. JEL 0842]
MAATAFGDAASLFGGGSTTSSRVSPTSNIFGSSSREGDTGTSPSSVGHRSPRIAGSASGITSPRIMGSGSGMTSPRLNGSAGTGFTSPRLAGLGGSSVTSPRLAAGSGSAPTNSSLPPSAGRTSAPPSAGTGSTRSTTTPNPYSAARLARANRSREPTIDAAASLFSAPPPVPRSTTSSQSSANFFDAFGLSDTKEPKKTTAVKTGSNKVLDVLGIGSAAPERPSSALESRTKSSILSSTGRTSAATARSTFLSKTASSEGTVSAETQASSENKPSRSVLRPVKTTSQKAPASTLSPVSPSDANSAAHEKDTKQLKSPITQTLTPPSFSPKEAPAAPVATSMKNEDNYAKSENVVPPPHSAFSSQQSMEPVSFNQPTSEPSMMPPPPPNDSASFSWTSNAEKSKRQAASRPPVGPGITTERNGSPVRKPRQPSPVPATQKMTSDSLFNLPPPVTAADVPNPPMDSTVVSQPPVQPAPERVTSPVLSGPAAIVPSVVENFDEVPAGRSSMSAEAVEAEPVTTNPFAETRQSEMQDNISFAAEMSNQDFSLAAPVGFGDNVVSQNFSNMAVEDSLPLSSNGISQHQMFDGIDSNGEMQNGVTSMNEFEEIDPNPRKYGLFQANPPMETLVTQKVGDVAQPMDDLDDLVLGTPATGAAIADKSVSEIKAPSNENMIPFGNNVQSEPPMFGSSGNNAQSDVFSTTSYVGPPQQQNDNPAEPSTQNHAELPFSTDSNIQSGFDFAPNSDNPFAAVGGHEQVHQDFSYQESAAQQGFNEPQSSGWDAQDSSEPAIHSFGWDAQASDEPEKAAPNNMIANDQEFPSAFASGTQNDSFHQQVPNGDLTSYLDQNAAQSPKKAASPVKPPPSTWDKPAQQEMPGTDSLFGGAQSTQADPFFNAGFEANPFDAQFNQSQDAYFNQYNGTQQANTSSYESSTAHYASESYGAYSTDASQQQRYDESQGGTATGDFQQYSASDNTQATLTDSYPHFANADSGYKEFDATTVGSDAKETAVAPAENVTPMDSAFGGNVEAPLDSTSSEAAPPTVPPKSEVENVVAESTENSADPNLQADANGYSYGNQYNYGYDHYNNGQGGQATYDQQQYGYSNYNEQYTGGEYNYANGHNGSYDASYYTQDQQYGYSAEAETKQGDPTLGDEAVGAPSAETGVSAETAEYHTHETYASTTETGYSATTYSEQTNAYASTYQYGQDMGALDNTVDNAHSYTNEVKDGSGIVDTSATYATSPQAMATESLLVPLPATTGASNASGYSETSKPPSQGSAPMPVEAPYANSKVIPCPSCSKEIDRDSFFCNKCGAKVPPGYADQLTAAPVTPAQVPAPVLPSQLPPPPMSVSSSKGHVPPPPPPKTGASTQGYSSRNNSYSSALPEVNRTSSVSSNDFNRPPPPMDNQYSNPGATQAFHNRDPYRRGVPPAGQSVPNDPNMYGGHMKRTASASSGYQQMRMQEQPPSFVDPLGRHKGHMIAVFGFGGRLILTKPRVQQRLVTGANGVAGMVEKSCPGELTIVQAQTFLADKGSLEHVPKFPGPLIGGKSKLKKKDVAKLAEDGIKQALDKYQRRLAEVISANGLQDESAQVDLQKLDDEALLWKLIKFTLHCDGNLLSGSKGDQSSQLIIDLLMSNGPSCVPASSLDEIETLLLKGDKAAACKVALSNELWAHALLIAAQIDKETYRDVVCQFSRKEFTSGSISSTSVSTASVDRPALRVLYSLFGGLGKLAINEYLPTYDECVTKGLSVPTISSISKWREVLAGILSNRTPGDVFAISALGDQLKSYGFNAAAHYLLTPGQSLLSGVDYPGVRSVLLGVNHNIFPRTFALHFDALHLTEIYEFSQSLVGNVGLAGCLPHLQAYKLIYACWLADHGFLELSSKYCEAIEQALKSYVKGSPYFHRTFIEALRDLAERLSTAQIKSLGAAADAKDSGNWFSKVSRFDGLMTALDRGIKGIMNGAIGEAPIEEVKPADMSRNSSEASKRLSQIPLSDTQSAYGRSSASAPPSMIRPSSSPAAVLGADGNFGNPHQTPSTTDYNSYGYSSYADNYLNESNPAPVEPAQPEGGSFVLASSIAPPLGSNNTDFGGVNNTSAVQQPPSDQNQGYDSGSYEQNSYNTQYHSGNDGYADNGYGYIDGQGQHYGGDASNTYNYGQSNEASYNDNQQSNQWSSEYQGYEQTGSYGYSQAGGNTDQHQGDYNNSSSWSQNVPENSYNANTMEAPAVQNESMAPRQNESPIPPRPPASFDNSPSRPSFDQPPRAASFDQPTRPTFDNPPPRASFDQPSPPTQTNAAPPSPAKPAQNAAPPQMDDDDDLGFGNTALKKAASVPDNSKISEKGKENDSKKDDKPEARTKEKSSSGSIFGRLLPSLFGSKKTEEKGAVKADLGEKMSLVYDPVQKRWINPKTGTPPTESAKDVPPPPMTSSWSAPSTRNPTPAPATPASGSTPPMVRPASAAPLAANSAPGTPPSSMSALNNPQFGAALGGGRSSVGSRRSARNKYVDIMNPEGTKSASSSSSSLRSFLPPTAGAQLMGSDGSGMGSMPKIMMPTGNTTTSSYMDAFDQSNNNTDSNSNLAQESTDSLNPSQQQSPPTPPQPQQQPQQQPRTPQQYPQQPRTPQQFAQNPPPPRVGTQMPSHMSPGAHQKPPMAQQQYKPPTHHHERRNSVGRSGHYGGGSAPVDI